MVSDRISPRTLREEYVEGFATAATGRLTGVGERAPLCCEQA